MTEAEDDELTHFLTAERGRLAPVNEQLERFYHTTYARLTALLEQYDVPAAPALRVVRSPFALTELLRTPTTTWIVYDQYLGQVFSRLSALVEQRAELASIDAYLTKLQANRLLVAGRGREALLMTFVHEVLRADDDFRAVPSAERWLSVVAQETFTLAHELVHHALSVSPAFREIWWDAYFGVIETADEIARENPARPDNRRAAEMLADDYNREYVRRHGDLDVDVLAQGHRELTRQYLELLAESPDVSPEAVSADVVLSEEAVCDGVAAVLTAQLLGQGDVDRTRATLVSCLEATQHLRLIKYMDGAIADRRHLPVVVHHTTARGHCLRLFLRGLYESELSDQLFRLGPAAASDPSRLQDLLDGLRDVNVVFYESVFDSLLTGSFYQRFEDPARRSRFDSAMESLPSPARSWQQAAELLGF